jgi:hypothetical protein
MKQDIVLIRQILLAIEEVTDGGSTIDIHMNPKATDDRAKRFCAELGGDYSDISRLTLIYHLKLLINGRIVDGTLSDGITGRDPLDTRPVTIPRCVAIYGLTYEGHNFLDGIRREDYWKGLKDKIKDMPLNMAQAVVTQFWTNLTAGWGHALAAQFLPPSS